MCSVCLIGMNNLVASVVAKRAVGGERPVVEIEPTLRWWCVVVVAALEGPAVAAVRAMLSRVGVGGTRPAVMRCVPCPGPRTGGRLGSAMLGKRPEGPSWLRPARGIGGALWMDGCRRSAVGSRGLIMMSAGLPFAPPRVRVARRRAKLMGGGGSACAGTCCCCSGTAIDTGSGGGGGCSMGACGGASR